MTPSEPANEPGNGLRSLLQRKVEGDAVLESRVLLTRTTRNQHRIL
jgi:hypothetical protein